MAEKKKTPINPLDWAREYLPAHEYAALLSALEEPLDIAIRINTLKWPCAEAQRALASRYGWTLEAIPFCPAGFWVRKPAIPPSGTSEHRLGYFYIQEAASMLPPELFSLDEGDDLTILDMAASPGGKTSHLAALNQDRGLIVANDGSRSRIPALQIVLRNWGAASQCVTCLPGESFGDLFPDAFDAVLLDAPCSMQGLRAADSHSARSISASEIDALATRQTRLLESALRAVRPGSQVVYSTCTLSPQENELVLAAILEKFGSGITIDDISNLLTMPMPAIRQIGGTLLPKAIGNALRLWPHRADTAGFFAARLTKLEDLPNENQTAWRLPPAKFYPTSLTAKQAESIIHFIRDVYGWELAGQMQDNNWVLCTQNDKIILLPERLLQTFNSLPILSAGLELGKYIGKVLIPSHEFVARFGDAFTHGILPLDDRYRDAWLRGEDIRGYRDQSIKSGSILAVRDEEGRNLGRGKMLNDRLKNMLPTRLF